MVKGEEGKEGRTASEGLVAQLGDEVRLGHAGTRVGRQALVEEVGGHLANRTATRRKEGLHEALEVVLGAGLLVLGLEDGEGALLGAEEVGAARAVLGGLGGRRGEGLARLVDERRLEGSGRAGSVDGGPKGGALAGVAPLNPEGGRGGQNGRGERRERHRRHGWGRGSTA